MKVERIYTGCLAQGAYYIESNGEAALIDPMSNHEQYVVLAERNKVRIKYIFVTHIRSDMIRNQVILSEKTDSLVVTGPKTGLRMDIYETSDEETFDLGESQIVVLHTPGHTLDSVSFLLLDKQQKEKAIFTGGTLYIGEIGRPGLFQTGDLITEDLAEMLYNSLRNKILTLPDEVTLYPGHGSGSTAGYRLRNDSGNTLGEQKKINDLLSVEMTQEEFVDEVIFGLLPPPQYYDQPDKEVKGEAQFDLSVLSKMALTPTNLEAMVIHDQALILDTRPSAQFSKEHIPGSIFIGHTKALKELMKSMVPNLSQAIVLVCAKGVEPAVINELMELGYTNILGYLHGAMISWQDSGRDVAEIKSISAAEFAHEYKMDHLNILDTRKSVEYNVERINPAQSFPLEFINANMNQIQQEKDYYLYCNNGYISMIVASILLSRGFKRLFHIAGGMLEITNTHVPISDYALGSAFNDLRK